MKNVLVIKDADFSDYAIEKISLDAPPVAFLFATTGAVTMTATGASEIRYTTDGSDPTANSSLYSTPVTVAPGTTVKAIAVYTGGKTSQVSSAKYNAGGSSILYKLDYTLGFTTEQSTALTEMALSGYAISDFIPVPGYADLNVNYGASIQTMGMWNDYYKFKIVEYDENKQVAVSTEQRTNSTGIAGAAVGNNCIWSIRDGSNNIDYKNVPIQQATRYIKIVVKLGTSANVIDKSNNNVLFQYIPN